VKFWASFFWWCRLDQLKTAAISFSRRRFGNAEMLEWEILSTDLKETIPTRLF
jgi:hypothetical protein